jgi:hypothetical protein
MSTTKFTNVATEIANRLNGVSIIQTSSGPAIVGMVAHVDGAMSVYVGTVNQTTGDINVDVEPSLTIFEADELYTKIARGFMFTAVQAFVNGTFGRNAA